MPPSHQLLDWTRGSASRWLPEHYRVLEEMDWKRTPLGDRDDWSTSFRTIVNTIMSHPYQMIIYWSKHYVVLYNEVYVDVVRNRHPALLGTKLKESWPEAYEQIHRYLDDAMLGQNMIQIGDVIPVDRSDHPEECYFDWTLFPLIEKAGNVGGVLWQQYESTERVLHNRRKQVLVSIQASTGPVRELVDYWPAVLEAFDSNTFDSPFLLIYEVSAQTQNQGVLRGKRGVPDGHVIAPNIFLIEQNGTFFASDVIKAQIVKTKVLVEGLLGNPSLADIKSRGFCEPCLRAVVIPIFCKKDDSRIEAFIILGINPRRPFDPQYELWVDKLRFQISSDIDRLRSMKELLEERMQREVDAVNARRASELEEKLAQKEITLRKSEMKFSNMAKVIPVGILELDPQGMVTYTNDAWHDIMGIPRGEDQNTWVEHIHKDDRAWWSKRLEEALVLKEHVPVEYRLIGNDQEKWVTTEVKPMFDDSKKLSGFYSTVVDVTPLKKSQQAEKKRADEAVEANKQQERFIDMTCHELRNPLGAILQCSELIKDHVHSEREKSRHEGRAPNLKPIIESCNTIILCSQHQRRIVDDILITSKLDSNLLPVVPRSIRPMAQLEKSSKVFEAEAKKRNIKLLFHVDDSYTENNIKYVTIDPSRLWQLTSNLITNSIKFTREKDGEKTITVRVGASLTEPKSFGNVKYTERDTSEVDDGKNPIDYGEGEFLYLMVSVIDTGIGISESDQKKLFQRFQQAPKTESKYGGSGLGLYICRNLAKLQGGSIGIYSKEGEGSEFSFYVKCKRSHPTTIEAEVENNIEFITPYSEASIHDDPTSEDTATQDTIKFLVVEDNNVNRMVLKKQLEAKNCLAYTAVDGKVAVDFVRKSSLGAGSDQDAKTIDICLMASHSFCADCEMPVMNGMEACQKIREMEASGELTGHLPILGVSANAREEKVEEMRASGMDDVISKPFMLSKLMEKAIQLIKIRDTAKWSATLGKAKQRDLRFASDQDILNRNEIHSDDEYGV
ncbi:hypothetical protein EDC01DRAFT_711209 [Geopyxis carbonaria]|nr:hypothetical protein EDC01DRAFT_711209 [Geopyxis carbonaria]